MNGGTLVLGALFFTFQIYGDFSGYSDIAIGTSRLFGFDLMQNFKFPYFSRDIAEFWRRWHVSLSTWFRDYLYIPLGGSRGGVWMKIRNTFIIFLVSGFWHGANWTFIVWGGLNALYFLPLLLTNNNRNNLETVAQGKLLPSIKEFLAISFTFTLTVFAWIFFRAENIGHAFSIIYGIIQFSDGISPYNLLFAEPVKFLLFICFFCIFIFIEWIARDKQHSLQLTKTPQIVLWALYLFLFTSIFLFSGAKGDFIYFQF
jgi:D-alanyl-lipoteichoic acid acyltransferase DltB (MBOAT superfamily)